MARNYAIPSKMRCHGRRHSPLWDSSVVREARKQRNKPERRYLFDKSEACKIKRRESSMQLKSVVKNAVMDSENQLATNADAKPFWHYIRSKNKLKTLVGPLVDPSTGTLSESALQ